MDKQKRETKKTTGAHQESFLFISLRNSEHAVPGKNAGVTKANGTKDTPGGEKLKPSLISALWDLLLAVPLAVVWLCGYIVSPMRLKNVQALLVDYGDMVKAGSSHIRERTKGTHT